ncbi:MAG: type II toxin-antitoxin system mRNA interferase toxin, RelE/StbE family [bacterium]|nr:type II toxin-antitoxin system mRNA interferase toxin, RelE/StbE family [bacterium]
MGLYKVELTNRARRNLRKYTKARMIKSSVFEDVLEHLENSKPLPRQYKDHKLQGELGKLRECHLSFHMLMNYEKDEQLRFIFITDIGTHDELFG